MAVGRNGDQSFPVTNGISTSPGRTNSAVQALTRGRSVVLGLPGRARTEHQAAGGLMRIKFC